MVCERPRSAEKTVLSLRALRRFGPVCCLALSVLVAVGAAACKTGPSSPAVSSGQEVPKAAERPAVEVRAEVDRAEVLVGEPVVFRVLLSAAPNVSVSLPDVGGRIQGLRIVDMGQDAPREIMGRRESGRWYRLEADLSGSYVLPVIKVPYTGPDGKEAWAETEPVYLKVLPPKPLSSAGEKPADIRDLKPLVEIRRPLPVRWILAASALLAAAAGAGFLLWRRGRRKTATPPTPEEHARRELADLDASGLVEEQRFREYVFGLSLVFRRYLERKFGIPAAEQTTEEVLQGLRNSQRLGDDLKRTARAFLEGTDPIKYRGLEPDRKEMESWRSELVKFVERAAAPDGNPLLSEAA